MRYSESLEGRKSIVRQIYIHEALGKQNLSFYQLPDWTPAIAQAHERRTGQYCWWSPVMTHDPVAAVGTSWKAALALGIHRHTTSSSMYPWVRVFFMEEAKGSWNTWSNWITQWKGEECQWKSSLRVTFDRGTIGYWPSLWYHSNSHNKYKNRAASTAPESTLKICLTRARNNDRIETKACLGKTIMWL